VGHNWVKGMFVTFAVPFAIARAAAADGGMERQYIPARLEDNPTLLANDPGYEQRLEGLGSPGLVRAMRKGDWDIVEGGFFDDLWDAEHHVLVPFQIPASWRLDRSFDWGSSKPFSVGWWAEADGTEATLPDGRRWAPPRGSLIRVAEWYGCEAGESNVGLRMSATDIARGIIERERLWRDRLGWHVHPGPADSSIWTPDDDNVSIADKMARQGVKWLEADKSPNSRKNGWELLRGMLRAARERRPEEPGLWVFNSCTQFIRTIPVLPRDPVKTDDVDTKAEDHIGDETRYRVLAKRPGRFTTTTFTR
ncbi:MAG: terminase, partial [Patescibacteria group bacterium]|nr:terminase [Patescibacteria group bacterium]